jgi:biotin carboxyl carrier protein
MLCTPADHPFGKVHIIPAQIQDCAEPLEGMSMSEGTIVKWFKQVGDRVEQGEPLVEIEDAKAVNTL